MRPTTFPADSGPAPGGLPGDRLHQRAETFESYYMNLVGEVAGDVPNLFSPGSLAAAQGPALLGPGGSTGGDRSHEKFMFRPLVSSASA